MLNRELGQAFANSSQLTALLSPYLGDNRFIINRYCGAKIALPLVVLWCESEPGHLRVTLASVLSLL